MSALLQPLLSYLSWATSLRPSALAGVAVIAPPAVLAAVVWLLLFSGGSGNSGPTASISEECAGFSSLAVTTYCNDLSEGDVLDCDDFASQEEATRFIRAHDTANENRLEQAAESGSFCFSLALGVQTPLAGSSGTAVATSTPTTVPTPSPTPTPSTYTVEPGDNPTLIAQTVGVPADEIDAWVAELLALNDVEATALFVGATLILPPFGASAQASSGETGAGTTPANTGNPGGSTGSGGTTGGGTTGGGTANPQATSIPVVVAPTATLAPGAPTNTPAPTNTTAPGQPTNTPIPTNTTAPGLPTATATTAAAPTATNTSVPPTVAPTQSLPATFSITSFNPATGQATYTGANYTANDTTTIEYCWVELGLCGPPDSGPVVGASGTFSGTVQDDLLINPPIGTYRIEITDSNGKTASDTITVS